MALGALPNELLLLLFSLLRQKDVCRLYRLHVYGTNGSKNIFQNVSMHGAMASNPDCIVLFSISPHLFCYLLRVCNSVFMRL